MIAGCSLTDKRPCKCERFSEVIQPGDCQACWDYWHDFEVFIGCGGDSRCWAKIYLQNKARAVLQGKVVAAVNVPPPRKCGCR